MKLIDKLPSFYKNYMVEAIQDSYDSELSSLKENIHPHGVLICGKVYCVFKIMKI